MTELNEKALEISREAILQYTFATKVAMRAAISAYLSALPEREPVAWWWKGPKGGFIANDKKPSWPAEPLFASPVAYPLRDTANCCNCGRIIDTREMKDGGDPFGAQISDGRWTCSVGCWDAVVDPEEAEAKLAAELLRLQEENARIRIETIEECAKIAEAWGDTYSVGYAVARGIRALPIDKGDEG